MTDRVPPTGSLKIRFGLCCVFEREPVRFFRTTAARIGKSPTRERLAALSALCLRNAEALATAVETCDRLDFKAFRVNSQIFPLRTHPEVGYDPDTLPDRDAISAALEKVRRLAAERDVRLSFHPDQFVVLASPDPRVVANSVAELLYQCQVAERIGAAVVNLHLGGAYGDKEAAKTRFARQFERLPEIIRSRLTLENDDKLYSVRDLRPLCDALGVPLVYDVHHHRVVPDGLTVAEATDLAIATWKARDAEPWFHISSPKDGWNGKNPRPHADYIRTTDFPDEWLRLRQRYTLDVEAKAKEPAIEALRRDLAGLSPTAD